VALNGPLWDSPEADMPSLSGVETDSRSDDEYGHAVSRLLEQTVRDELAIAAGIDGVELSDETLDHFAWAVLTQLDYGFRFQWDPQWVPAGEPHSWAESSTTPAASRVLPSVRQQCPKRRPQAGTELTAEPPTANSRPATAGAVRIGMCP
jgi:hypothetical protein